MLPHHASLTSDTAEHFDISNGTTFLLTICTHYKLLQLVRFLAYPVHTCNDHTTANTIESMTSVLGLNAGRDAAGHHTASVPRA